MKTLKQQVKILCVALVFTSLSLPSALASETKEKLSGTSLILIDQNGVNLQTVSHKMMETIKILLNKQETAQGGRGNGAAE